jgi:hypothetical protein
VALGYLWQYTRPGRIRSGPKLVPTTYFRPDEIARGVTSEILN